MSAFFYKKKSIFAYFSVCLSMIFTLGCFLYACVLSLAMRVENRKTFYFLVSACESVEVGYYQVVFDGGAGYLMKEKDRDCVAYAVYFSKTRCDQAALALENADKEADILVRETKDLYLKKGKEKKKYKQIRGALEGLFSCLKELEKVIEKLQQGVTQFSSKESVRALVEQLQFLSNAYQSVCENYRRECQSSAERLNGCLNGVLLCKDLRYELCVLCNLYLQTSEKFYL